MYHFDCIGQNQVLNKCLIMHDMSQCCHISNVQNTKKDFIYSSKTYLACKWFYGLMWSKSSTTGCTSVLYIPTKTSKPSSYHLLLVQALSDPAIWTPELLSGAGEWEWYDPSVMKAINRSCCWPVNVLIGQDTWLLLNGITSSLWVPKTWGWKHW